MDHDALLAYLLELDRVGRLDAMRPYVEAQIDSWGPEVFEAIAVAQWDAGDETERLAAEEQRRGLPGLGGLPEVVRAAIADFEGDAESEQRPEEFEMQRCTPLEDRSRFEGLDDDEVATRAETAMLRWEALCRVEEGVFSRVAVAWTREAGQSEEPRQVGAGVLSLLSGEVGEGGEDVGVWITALALGERLVRRGVRWVERLVDAIDQGRLCPPAAIAPAARDLSLRLRWLAGSPVPSSTGPSGSVSGASPARHRLRVWLLEGRRLWDREPIRTGSLAARVVRGAWERHLRADGGMATVTLASAHEDTGSRARARELLEAALAIHCEVGDRRGEGVALSKLADLHHETGSPTRARELFGAALAIYREAGDRENEGRTLHNFANLHLETGSPARARELFDAAITIHREVGNRRSEGVTLGDLAIVHLETGSPARAQELFDAALAIHREVGDRRSEGIVLSNLAGLHLETDSPARARELYAAVLAIHREVGDRRSEGRALANLAIAHRQTGSPARARELFEAALTIHREVGNRLEEGLTLGNLAHVHREVGSPARARELFEAALAIHRELGCSKGEGSTLSALATVHHETGSPAQGLAHAARAVELLARIGDTAELRGAYHIHARTLAATGARPDALTAYRHAIAAHEAWLRDVGSDRRRARLLEEALPCFQDAVSFLLGSEPPAADDVAEAFDVAERGKARSLLERVRACETAAEVPPELAEERAHLEVRLRALQEALLRERSRPEPRQRVIDYIEAELAPVRTEHTRLLDDLAMRFPVYAAEEGLTPPVPLADVQARVVASPDAALLEYLVTEAETFCWVVLHDRVAVVRLGLGEEALEARVSECLGAVSRFRETRNASTLLALLPDRLAELATVVLGPVLPHLEGVRRLLVVPSGALFDLPFEMLVLGHEPEARADGDRAPCLDHFATARYVADRFDVAYGPSATLLDPALRAEGPQRPRVRAERTSGTRVAPGGPSPVNSDTAVLALGDPAYESLCEEPALTRAATRGLVFGRLPGTRKEVEALKRLFSNVRALTRTRVKESAYRRHAPDADIVHVGCHGVLDPDEPAYSGIVLSPSRHRDEDAFFQAYEIARVSLPRQPLVVVSACEVAGGVRSSSEGLLGLTRAFIAAGAGSVVASTWPVDDAATARLMTCFYEAIATGDADPIAALAGAKRAMLAEARQPTGSRKHRKGSSQFPLPPAHPYFWAGFGIHGISALVRVGRGTNPDFA